MTRGDAALKLLVEGLPFPRLTAGKTALLIIDVTYKDAHPDYGIGRLLLERGLDEVHREYYASVKAILPNIQRLSAACRKAGIDVVCIHVAAATVDCRDMLPSYKLVGISSPGLWAPAGSIESQILEEVAPHPGDIVLSKTSASVFNSTNLDRILRNIGVDSLIATGVVTNGCVEASVRHGADIGYNVVLVSDATTALTREEHEDTIHRLSGLMTHVRATSEVIAAVNANVPEGARA